MRAITGRRRSSSSMANSGMAKKTCIVLVQVKNAAAESWFHAAGKSLAEVQGQIDHLVKPQSFVFPDQLRVSIHVDIETTRATVNNVLAYLPGKSDEYVIIGAHYDHLRSEEHTSELQSQSNL